MTLVSLILLGGSVVILGLVGLAMFETWRQEQDKKRAERKRRIQGAAQQTVLEAEIAYLPTEVEEWLAAGAPPVQTTSPTGHGSAVYNQERPTFEPPYVRLECSGCGARKDGWVNEDGTLQQDADYECRANSNLPCFGKPMRPVED